MHEELFINYGMGSGKWLSSPHMVVRVGNIIPDEVFHSAHIVDRVGDIIPDEVHHSPTWHTEWEI